MAKTFRSIVEFAIGTVVAIVTAVTTALVPIAVPKQIKPLHILH